VRITERSDRIESLLIRHDEQYIGPGGHFLEASAQTRELVI
jgi:hypothetical protein